MENVKSYRQSRSCEESNTSRLAKGVIFILVGLVILLHQIPTTRHLIPDWLFGVHTLLIVIGIYSGIKHNFSNIGWLVLILIGIMMALQRFTFIGGQDLALYGIPFGLIIVGIFVMFKKRN